MQIKALELLPDSKEILERSIQQVRELARRAREPAIRKVNAMPDPRRIRAATSDGHAGTRLNVKG